MHAAQQERSVVIQCTDTDVFVLSVAFSHDIPTKLFVANSDNTIIDIKEIEEQYGTDFCEALLGFHAFTGNDSVSCFAGKGKVKPLVLMQSSTQYIDAFKALGKGWDLPEDTVSTLECFVSELYGYKEKSMAEARFQHFRKTWRLDKTLPPDRDSLGQHCARANYQAAIWRRATEPNPQIPDPTTSGWELDNFLSPRWLTKPCLPDSLKEKLTRCGCSKNKCESSRCSCRANGLVCTDLCSCTDCVNHSFEDVLECDSDTDTDDL